MENIKQKSINLHSQFHCNKNLQIVHWQNKSMLRIIDGQ